jgi:hypothetical protein
MEYTVFSFGGTTMPNGTFAQILNLVNPLQPRSLRFPGGAGPGGALDVPPMPSRSGDLCNCGCTSRCGEAPLPPGNGLLGVEDCYLVC